MSAEENPAVKSPAQLWLVGTIDSIYLTTGKYPSFTVKLILENSDVVVLQRELRRHGIPGLESYVVKTPININTTVELVDRQMSALESATAQHDTTQQSSPRDRGIWI